jgi:phosphoribosylaminoimidazolecarboxamide formyltransferase/IMP cyclohydrolase
LARQRGQARLPNPKIILRWFEILACKAFKRDWDPVKHAVSSSQRPLEVLISFKLELVHCDSNMTEDQNLGLRKIRRALISVSDKTGIVDFARELQAFEVEIISTGGTAKALREAGIDVREVSDVTGFPEIMDGRVKTLHPKIHGGLLGVRDNPEHEAAMQQHGIQPIDLVVINLYPFEETIARDGVSLEEAIEQIDIGGPAMIRSAAKNFASVAAVTARETWQEIIDEMKANEGALCFATRHRLAAIAYTTTFAYDAYVSRYLFETSTVELPEPAPDELPSEMSLSLDHHRTLRYGENPHQLAALYELGPSESETQGVAGAELLSGKEMSFNNYVDADAAWELVCDFDETACAIIKHTNPAGVGLNAHAREAYRKALATDPVSAFGGIVAFNCPVDEAAARSVIEIFTEVLIAPDYDDQALEVLRSKKNLRVLRALPASRAEGVEYNQISGGMLVQTRDTHRLKREDLKVVTKRQPTADQIDDLLFAWTVCKHTKSNAIVYARDGQTVGVGAGQMSRVDSVKLGAMRAQLPINGSVLASVSRRHR